MRADGLACVARGLGSGAACAGEAEVWGEPEGLAVAQEVEAVNQYATAIMREALTCDVVPVTPGGVLVTLCATLGSPVSEQARVVDVAYRRLMGAVYGGAVLTPMESDVLAVWGDCLAWRTWWRMGLASARTAARMEQVERLALSLDWVPRDWRDDHAAALVGLGEAVQQALTRAQVACIVAEVAAGERQVDVAARYGVSQPRVSQLVRRARV